MDTDALRWLQQVADGTTIDQDAVNAITTELMRPLEVWEESRTGVTRGEVNPTALSPKQSLLRLQKIMDEYVAGQGSGYIPNGPTLERGLELLKMLREDLPRMAARDRHDLLRAWEVWDRFYCAEAHARNMLFREETRWPGYY